MDIKKIDINRKMEEFKLKKIKLFGSMLVLMAIVGAAAPASAAVVAGGELDSDTTITIENIKEDDDTDFNKLQLKAVPSMFNYGTHNVSEDTITANAKVTGDAKVMDTRFIKGEKNAPADTELENREWELSASYTQADLTASNTLVSLDITMGTANNQGATGTLATLIDGDVVPVVTVPTGVVGNYVFKGDTDDKIGEIKSTMVITDTNAGTYDGTITFELNDTI